MSTIRKTFGRRPNRTFKLVKIHTEKDGTIYYVPIGILYDFTGK